MFAESDLLPLSALQHLLFCERQCALIHLEQAWTENVFTAEGRLMHERVHGGGGETRKGVRTAFGLAVRSLRLGLTGQADVVEMGRGQVRPVEHKRGRPKRDNCDAVQLCAQALCLEEMLGVEISAGDLFYGKTRRRQEIVFDEALRAETESAARRLHELMARGVTPPPVFGAHCKSCSFQPDCLPGPISREKSIRRYLAAICRPPAEEKEA
jgi:CRISPR-associated exonuclease Cas4